MFQHYALSSYALACALLNAAEQLHPLLRVALDPDDLRQEALLVEVLDAAALGAGLPLLVLRVQVEEQDEDLGPSDAF